MKKITPLGNNILIKFLKVESEYKNIDLPEKAKEAPSVAEVIAVGTGKQAPVVSPSHHVNSGGGVGLVRLVRWQIDVKVGDKVLVKKWGGNELPGKDMEDYRIIDVEDILAITE